MCIIAAVVIEGYKFIEKNQPLRLTCNATGRDAPPHDVRWYKDGNPMETLESEGIFIRKKIEPLMLVSFLEIRAARSSDSGDYVCRSSNGDHAAVNVHILNGESPSNQHCTAQWKSARSRTHSCLRFCFLSCGRPKATQR